MKIRHILTFGLLLLTTHSFAATITVDGTGTRSLRDAFAGDPVLAGSKVWVGYFTGLTDSEIVANEHNTSLLLSKFIAFGLGGAVGQGVGGANGYFTFSTKANVESPGATFVPPSLLAGSPIYIWTFNSASSPVTATQQAIFTSTDTDWRWPASDDGSSDRTISPDDNLLVLVGSADGDGVYLRTMPEPGSCLLLMSGVVGLLGMRPRKERAGAAHDA